jgi:hypothetical protein
MSLYDKETLSLTWSNAQIWGTAGPYLSGCYAPRAPKPTTVVSGAVDSRPADRRFAYYSIGYGSAISCEVIQPFLRPSSPPLAPVRRPRAQNGGSQIATHTAMFSSKAPLLVSIAGSHINRVEILVSV